MCRLAMCEDEFGSYVTGNRPKRKEYVGARTAIFFLVESLLYLFICGCIGVAVFFKHGFNLTKLQIGLSLGAMLLIYLIITYVGLVMVKLSALNTYEKIRRARKVYRRNLHELSELIENESR